LYYQYSCYGSGAKKMLLTRNEIVEQLQVGKLEVTFNKVNGDKRIMTCTLKEDAIPGYKPANKDKKVNKEVVSVWDINAEGWRSFRLANITEVATV
jgi:hypothetical protein